MQTQHAIVPAAPSETARMKPEEFANLTKKLMMRELKRLEIARGKSKKKKAELVRFYREWHAKSDGASVVNQPAPLSDPPTKISTPPQENVPATFTLSPDISVKTLPPAEQRAIEELVEQIERRESPRVALEVQIGFRSETNFFVGFSADISEGGIFVATVNLLPRGTLVKLEFALPDGAEVSAEGTVAWTRERVSFDSEVQQGMGVTFSRVDAAGLKAIHEYMQHRDPLFHVD